MDNLKVGQLYTVKTRSSKGIGLRKEPKRNAPIMMTLPKGSEVKLASTETRTSSGRNWYNISHMHNEKEKMGWIASDYLQPIGNSNTSTVSSDDVLLSIQVSDVKYNGILQYSSADLQSIPATVKPGAVTFFFANSSQVEIGSTSLTAWNTAAGKDGNGKQRYPIKT